MSKLESAKQTLDYVLNHAMKTLDQAILLIPDDKLDWKPTEDAKSAGELGSHVYMGSLAHMAGTLKGEFLDDDYSLIPFDAEKVKSVSEIIEYGEKIKSYIKDNFPKLT
jgi:hypothetical protein